MKAHKQCTHSRELTARRRDAQRAPGLFRLDRQCRCAPARPGRRRTNGAQRPDRQRPAGQRVAQDKRAGPPSL